ncbi:MAG: 1-acyl-sn-glycerol-3-phosphate acyltransferase, partial [Blastocatellia bacterium]|nr:1-acyl-sn-glycerol-3-phosphate acyltransferase [Blastocatellia bacterium]
MLNHSSINPLLKSGAHTAHLPTVRALWQAPLVYQHSLLNRLLIRGTLLCGLRLVRSVTGLEHLAEARDPFIVALNHSQRLEAVLLPMLFIWQRQGKLIHFLADWNFLMTPAALFLWRGGVIPVTRKPARPRFLTGLRNYLVATPHGFERAKELLRAGRSVGIFPEGTTNRHPTKLLAGQLGAARLSLETGASLIPVGIRFPTQDKTRPVASCAPMEVHIGTPLTPPHSPDPAPAAAVRDWHAELMRAIADLTDKTWSPAAA